MKIKETCCCGAKFEVEGNNIACSWRYREFLEAHKICRKKLQEVKIEIIPDISKDLKGK